MFENILLKCVMELCSLHCWSMARPVGKTCKLISSSDFYNHYVNLHNIFKDARIGLLSIWIFMTHSDSAICRIESNGSTLISSTLMLVLNMNLGVYLLYNSRLPYSENSVIFPSLYYYDDSKIRGGSGSHCLKPQ